MYNLTENAYRSLAEELLSALDYPCYFSGAVTISLGDVDIRLVASLFIHRNVPTPFSDDTDFITRIIPVWWDCIVTDSEGEEVENNFDFKEFTKWVKAL